MPAVSFTNLLIISAIAVLAPLAVGFVPRLRIPAVVLEIVAGIVVGPSVLGWVHVDLPVQILALFVLLSLFSSRGGGGPGAKLLLLVAFAGVVVAPGLAVTTAGRSMRLAGVLVRLQDTTAEIRVRFAVVLLVAFTFLAERFGLESILGAFLAGAVVSLVDRDQATHPRFRVKLEAIGYGFLVPVFFVGSGVRLDLTGLLDHPSALARVPLFLLALLVARGVPALLGVRAQGWRATVAIGLLQATSLPFIVTATQIGVTLGKISSVTAAALVCAGLLSVLIFPVVALGLLRGTPQSHLGMVTGGTP